MNIMNNSYSMGCNSCKSNMDMGQNKHFNCNTHMTQLPEYDTPIYNKTKEECNFQNCKCINNM